MVYEKQTALLLIEDIILMANIYNLKEYRQRMI